MWYVRTAGNNMYASFKFFVIFNAKVNLNAAYIDVVGNALGQFNT